MGLVVRETADQLADFINEENAGNLQALFEGIYNGHNDRAQTNKLLR